MHPLSTALFLVGYGLALPIAAKMSTVVGRQSRLGLFGHQAGIMIAVLGWIFRGAIFVAVGHVIWLFVAYAWFTYLGPSRQAATETVTKQRRRWSRRGGSTG